MNPRTWNLKWVAAFAVAAVVGVAGVIVVLSVMEGGGEQATAQPANPTETVSPEATASPGATAQAGATEAAVSTYPVQVPSVAPGAAPMVRVACPAEGWQRISDDKANYSFCLPPGWAILDPVSSEPSTRTTIHWESASILSPEAFPYPYAGSYEKGPTDLIRDSGKNVVWMQLVPYWADEGNPLHMTCVANPSGLLGTLPSASCENHFSIPSGSDEAIPDPQGEWERLFVVVPLPNAQAPPGLESSPYPTPEGGYSLALGIIFEGRNEALAYYHNVIYQILGTLDGQS